MKFVIVLSLILFAQVVNAEDANAEDADALQHKCIRGNQESCKTLFELLKQDCDEGNSHACNNLGVMYERGEGMRQNKYEALKYYEMACSLHANFGCQNYAKLKNRKN